MSDVLLLNGDSAPISIIPLSVISWQEAISLIYKGRATVVEIDEKRTISSPSMTMAMPTVIMLNQYFKKAHRPKFCKDSLLYRDEFRCLYCGNEFPKKKLTMDHFIPKSKGGGKSFENILMSCQPCNLKKGDKFMEPLKKPHVPTYFELANKRKKFPIYINHESWKHYIDWDESLIIVGKDKDNSFKLNAKILD